MDNVIKQRLKLEQKKANILMQEAKMKIRERKARTRHLIELGGLVVKAKLDCLPANSLLGALVSLQNELIQHPNVQDQWTQAGKNIFDQKNDQNLLS
ncbi:MAG: conjugal transfer protein TraD [Rickettsia endosymbiont of Ixodes persulcatus]|uniref:Conjugal transfer protein TraD n=1 Tax=Rickettsia helvetica TaxID=35789 RepID=A0ABP0T6H0_RICHE|nr:conjugal transfer protein TraD [Rickettsia helvetica]MCZ6884247.1 conjugal transfer protein TraD [Rickettsia endosymbiont of Ixodes ricinus]MCZ6902624.1 conjugal transfer protein TraD [Rickettsia endosymbiont of Ixodes persulcatus]MDJ1288186.1 conjugal transfer protein TraD [Candidatus Midichloria mitochondrii]MCZ6896769.1 conjugal transfer protein TraD [Rickettsia endosymbiont of Ixodes ricinus]MCZ6903386.1 conjugal transfer protein TraD [Rickettsia endosymbiont of Ixodes persulcatus]